MLVKEKTLHMCVFTSMNIFWTKCIKNVWVSFLNCCSVFSVVVILLNTDFAPKPSLIDSMVSKLNQDQLTCKVMDLIPSHWVSQLSQIGCYFFWNLHKSNDCFTIFEPPMATDFESKKGFPCLIILLIYNIVIC